MVDEGVLPISGGSAAMKASKSRNGRPQKCACKNSKCLKLYCDCFSVGQKCDGCNCQDCHNTEAFSAEIESARKSVIKRNPKAFAAKFVEESGNLVIQTKDKSSKHARGCNCSKSRCIKNYCECWQMGITCNDKCKCVNCANGKPPAADGGGNLDEVRPTGASLEGQGRRLSMSSVTMDGDVADAMPPPPPPPPPASRPRRRRRRRRRGSWRPSLRRGRRAAGRRRALADAGGPQRAPARGRPHDD